MLIPYIAEPVDLTLILKQPQRHTMHRRVAPALVEEPARTVKMVEELAIRLAPPETQVADFEVRPEVAGGVAMCFVCVFRTALVVFEPLAGVIWVDEVRIVLEEFLGFGPERGDAVGAVVDVDVEAVRLVVVLHPGEDVVVDVAEEMYVGLDAPVVLYVFERRVLAEEAAVPPAHLVVGLLVHVLHFLLDKERDGLVVEVHVYPGGDVPVLGGHELVSYFGVCGCFGGFLEFFGEGLVVEEGPRVVELVVPRSLQILHALQHILEFFISY